MMKQGKRMAAALMAVCLISASLGGPVLTAGAEVTKDVTEIENNHDTFAVGQTHTWIILGDIPVGMGTTIFSATAGPV